MSNNYDSFNLSGTHLEPNEKPKPFGGVLRVFDDKRLVGIIGESMKKFDLENPANKLVLGFLNSQGVMSFLSFAQDIGFNPGFYVLDPVNELQKYIGNRATLQDSRLHYAIQGKTPIDYGISVISEAFGLPKPEEKLEALAEVSRSSIEDFLDSESIKILQMWYAHSVELNLDR